MAAQNRLKYLCLLGITIITCATPMLGDDPPREEAPKESKEDKYSFDDCLSLNDQYLEGYIQARLDQNFGSYSVKVIVHHRQAYLYRMPKDPFMRESINRMVKKTPGITAVKVKENAQPPLPAKMACPPVHKKPKVKGIWFPQNTVLFPPLIANPRAVLNSISYRWQWQEASNWLGKNAVAVSFGDIFPIYRFIDLCSFHMKLQFSLEAASWAIFRIDHHEPNDWSEFVNADYFLGIPITMAVGNLSSRLRIYHVSTHLGDELLVNNPGLLRLNPSYEGVDLFFAYQFGENFKPYAGMGVIFRTDQTFEMKPLYFEWGGEYRFLRQVVHYNRLYGQAFVAAHFLCSQTRNYNLDSTVVAGYEWSKLRGAGRRFRIFMEWHHGYAPDGQFFKQKLSYFGFRISYGF